METGKAPSITARPSPNLKTKSKRNPKRRSKRHAEKRRHSKGRDKAVDRQPLTQAVVSITTRFRQETAEALRRASLQRKLAGSKLSTQQEIVEFAVAAWLEREGYLSESK